MARSPLEGLKVLDMAWLMVGPESARYLGDLGAEVVKLESGVRRDPLRSLGPFKNGVPGPHLSLSYHAINAGKRSLALDLKDPRGHDAVLRLARWADVVVEAFTPGVAESLKVSYSHLRRENPRLIMVSTAVLGAKGPSTIGLSGTGVTGSALSGATNLVGWPDRDATGPNGPWTDSVSPRFIVTAILAALHRRERTGEGCFIDASQAECGIQFMMPAYFEFAVNGVVPQRRGHAGSPLRSPSGVYPCQGKDRWVAIETTDDEAWQALRGVVGAPLADSRFDTLVGRLRHRQALDEALAGYTAARENGEVERTLQALGVPCHIVSDASDLAADPDLQADAYYCEIEDPEIGRTTTRGPQSRLSRTPHPPTRPGPRIGDSSRDILVSICGLSGDEVDALERDGLLR
jgi:benzylsuccinate CoA-transferase BbsF subunit